MKTAIRADLLDFTAPPAWGVVDAERLAGAVRWRPDHWLLVGDDGRIADVVRDAPGPDWKLDDRRGALLLPGFVDAHVHSPQLGVIASYGTALLDWLADYTFPAERAWADRDVAERGSALFLDALLAHGTTAAVVMPTVHAHSAEALFAGAAARGMRVIGGKVLMDRHAADGLLDADTAAADRECRALISRWHGRGRNAFAVTVRFAPTSTPVQLALAGRLAAEDPTLYFHTHVAENTDEVRWVHALYPEARSYLDVYARAGLLHRRSVLAHGIWLDDADRAALRDSGATIAHCPSSNLFLGSGLFDWSAVRQAGARVALGSDVGGGTSLSLLRTLADAYKVQAMRGQRLTAFCGLHAATRGGAEALDLEHEIGSLDAGRAADFTLWRWHAGAVDGERQRSARSLHDKLFAWMTLADERHLIATHVAGQPAFVKETA